MRTLDIEERHEDGVLVLRFKHRRLETGFPINTHVTGRVREGATRVVADLSEVEWMHGKVAEGLIVTMMHVDELGGRMLCACLQPGVMETFRGLGIEPFPPIWRCASVDEAVEAFAESLA